MEISLASSGDTILTLENPNSPFAPWEGDNRPLTSTPPSPVTFRLSSHHLTQASPVFKAALTGAWKEGSTAAGGCYEINVEDWDAEAMRVVLSLIHCRTKGIPRIVTLEMLTKVAVLVDYYQLHEAVHFYASLWIDTLRHSLPTAYGRDLILWICVSWVFKDASIFKAVTKLAVEQSPGKVATLQLPIPERVISRIDAQREAALGHINSSLRNVRHTLINGKIGCSFECRSLLLGALIKFMHDEGFFEPGISAASKNRSVKATIRRVREMKAPSRDWHPRVPLQARSNLFGSASPGPSSFSFGSNSSAGSFFGSTDSKSVSSCMLSLGSLTEACLNKPLKSISGLSLSDRIMREDVSENRRTHETPEASLPFTVFTSGPEDR